jgi:CheY-like chemotaxis protein
MAGELILIVEDNDKNRKLVRDVLTFTGYEVIEAETGGHSGDLRHGHDRVGDDRGPAEDHEHRVRRVPG